MDNVGRSADYRVVLRSPLMTIQREDASPWANLDEVSQPLASRGCGSSKLGFMLLTMSMVFAPIRFLEILP